MCTKKELKELITFGIVMVAIVALVIPAVFHLPITKTISGYEKQIPESLLISIRTMLIHDNEEVRKAINDAAKDGVIDYLEYQRIEEIHRKAVVKDLYEKTES